MSYSSEVLADTPLCYWRMTGASGNESNLGSNSTAMTFANGPVRDVAGPLAVDEGAISFDGVDDYGQVTSLDLSGTSIITVEFWIKWDTAGTNDDMAMEFSANANSNNGFNFDWNNSTGAESGTVSVKVNDGVDADRYTFPRPTTGAWHHVVTLIDRSLSDMSPIRVWVDGSEVTITQRENGSGGTGGAFSNTNLYIMSRAGASLYGAGDMAELAIYDYALTSTRITAHYNAASSTGGPTPQNITIANSGGGALNWTASKTQTWLSLNKTSGVNNDTIIVTADPTGLSAGTYNDTITITATGAIDSPITVPVTFNVTGGTPPTQISASDTLTLGDASSPSAAASRSDVVTFGDASSPAADASRSDAATLSDASALSAQQSSAASDAATLSDASALSAQQSAAVSDAFTASDASAPTASASRADAATLTDASVAAPSLSVSETHTLTDSSAQAAAQSATDAATLSDASAAAPSLSVSETHTQSDASVTDAAAAASDSGAVSEAASAGGQQLNTASDSFAFADTAGLASQLVLAAVDSWSVTERSTPLLVETATDTANTPLENHVSDSGHTWTKHPGYSQSVGTMAISTSQRIICQALTGCYYSSWIPSSAEYDVEADLYYAGAGGGSYSMGLCGRLDTSLNSMYHIRYNIGSGYWELYLFDSGTAVALQTVQMALTVGQTYHVKLEIRDALKRVYVDGVPILSSTNNAVTAAGRAGMRCPATMTDTTGIQLDNFQATPAGASAYIGASSSRTDALTLGDSSAPQANPSRSDSSTFSDVSASAVALAAIDAVALTDSAVLASLLSLAASDAVAFTDAPATVLSVDALAASDSMSQTELAASIAVTLARIDSLTQSEGASVLVASHSRSDTMSMAELASLANALARADSAALTEAGILDQTVALAVFDSFVQDATAVLTLGAPAPDLNLPTRAAVALWAARATVRALSASAAVDTKKSSAVVAGTIGTVSVQQKSSTAAVKPYKAGVTVG